MVRTAPPSGFAGPAAPVSSRSWRAPWHGRRAPGRCSRGRTAVLLLALLPVIGACEDSPVLPDRSFSQLVVTCTPAGADVSCTAVVHGDPVLGTTGDVTAEATWSVSDPAIGGFVRPGLFTPTGDGEVGLSVSYSHLSSSEELWFLVGPGRTARWLYFLSGEVVDAGTGEALPGADVTVLDGYAAGTAATTNQFGVYQIDRILTEEAFSVVASREGYSDHEQTYRVDPPVGPNGNPPFLDFRLQPLP